MTKVECPGPGFKGLKWKWIQDHAKEQQERERLTVQHVQLPGSTQPNCQPDVSGTCNDPPQTSDIREQQTASHVYPCSAPASSHHALQSQSCVKAEPANGLQGPGSTARTAAGGDAQHAPSEDHFRIKEEQSLPSLREKAAPPDSRASPARQTASCVLDTTDASGLHAPTLAPGGQGASGGFSGSAAATAAGSSGLISPSATVPTVVLPGRKSVDAAVAVPSASSWYMAAVSPTVPHASLADTTQAPSTTGGVAGLVTGPPAAFTPSCILTPPAAAAAPAAQPQVAAAQPPSAAPSSAPPLASSAARVRLPPARAPSTVASVAIKGSDDFESMFTPLSSLPPTKSDTPRAGLPSRSSSLLVGSQGGAMPNAPPGATAAGSTAVTAAQDVGGDRKCPPKKVARMQDSRGNAAQASAGEQQDGESAPPARSRTPVSQLSPAGGGHPSGSSKEVLAPATIAAAPGKVHQQQPVAQLGQSIQQPSQTPTSVVHSQQQQRIQGGKAGKSGEGSAPPAAGTSGSGAAVAVGAGAPATGNLGGAGDRAGLPASAGSTPAAAPAHSGGEAGERKRPRSEGSKPKSGASLTGDPVTAAELAFPYGETLADRIKRAKRATTSSSDQEGHHSYGGSAERLPSHVAAAMAAHLAGGDGQDHAGGVARLADELSPRPAVSAEAQSRGAEAAPGCNPTRGSHGTTSGTVAAGGAGTAAGAAGAGDGGAGAAVKQEQQRQRPTTVHAVACRNGGHVTDKATTPDHTTQNPINNLRMSGGGAVTDSSGGGPAGAQRTSGPSASGKAAAGAQPPSTGLKRSAAEVVRRHNLPPAKFQRSDPHLPRPHQPHNQDRRSTGAATETPGAAATAAAGSGRPGSGLPPPPSGKLTHRASSGQPAGKTNGGQGQGPDGQGPPAGVLGTGQAPAPAGSLQPASRAARVGEGDMAAAGSCKGPVVAGSRGSKDGAGDKGACGPRHGGDGIDAACGGGGTGGGGPGAAATTTTEPKTDSDTRTSRVVECFFEFDLPCRIAAGSASISGLGSGSSLQGAPHGLAARLGGGRFFGATAAAAALSLPPSRSGGATAAAQLLDLGKIRSFKELWTQLAALYDGTLPDEMDSKIIYLDEEGDWIMVTPDEPWSSVAAAATKVLVTNRT